MTNRWVLPPIIERELRLVARRARTYWGRAGAAAAGIVLLLTVMNFQLGIAAPARAGQTTFRVLACVAGLMAVSTELQLAAAAFVREKREDTLGLLFLTPLKPRELLAGKLVAVSLEASYRFVAIIPLLALPMLAGGVSLSNFLALVLALANLMFLIGALGLNVSAHSWDEKRALSAAAVTLGGLGLVVPAILFGWVNAAGFLALGPYVFALSPFY